MMSLEVAAVMKAEVMDSMDDAHWEGLEGDHSSSWALGQSVFTRRAHLVPLLLSVIIPMILKRISSRFLFKHNWSLLSHLSSKVLKPTTDAVIPLFAELKPTLSLLKSLPYTMMKSIILIGILATIASMTNAFTGVTSSQSLAISRQSSSSLSMIFGPPKDDGKPGDYVCKVIAIVFHLVMCNYMRII